MMSEHAGKKLDRYLKDNASRAAEERKYGSARLRRWRGRAVSWLYLAPSLIGVGLFFVLPFGVVIYYSMITASHRDSTTANGTAIIEKSSVFRAASEKALFCHVRIKLLKPT